MRVVALEEHFTVPALVRRVDPALIARRGFPPPDAPWGPANRTKELAELGQPRLADMDQGGIAVQVLSASGPGADLLPPAEGTAFARDLNDTLARAVDEHPDRYAGFAHLPKTPPRRPPMSWSARCAISAFAAP